MSDNCTLVLEDSLRCVIVSPSYPVVASDDIFVYFDLLFLCLLLHAVRVPHLSDSLGWLRIRWFGTRDQGTAHKRTSPLY